MRLGQADEIFAALHAEHGPRFALAYLDPPFFSGREYRHANGELAFDDRWPDRFRYLEWLRRCVRAARELLDSSGCLVLHLDTTVAHYAKVMCDEIFGCEAFASEIVWRYRRWPTKTKNFQRVHDVLLRYVRDPHSEPRWHQLFEPLAESTVKAWGNTRQRAVLDQHGRRTRSSRTAENSPGTALGDVWDIPIIAPSSRERTGYPTQKPEALLERLVLACTSPGDWILDGFTGSGTLLAVAQRLGRNAIGVDKSDLAIETARRRIAAP